MVKGKLVGLRIDIGTDWIEDWFGDDEVPDGFDRDVAYFYGSRCGEDVDVEVNYIDNSVDGGNPENIVMTAFVDYKDGDPVQEVGDWSREFDRFVDASTEDQVWHE